MVRKALRRRFCVTVGFGEIRFACRKQLVHPVFSAEAFEVADKSLIYPLGYVWLAVRINWFNPNLLNVARRAWSAAMLFEAVIGCGSLNPRPCGEWLKRGLRCRKLVCPPRF